MATQIEDNQKQAKKNSRKDYLHVLAVSTISNFNGRPYNEAMEFIEHLKYVLGSSSEINSYGRDEDRITRSKKGTEEYYLKQLSKFYN